MIEKNPVNLPDFFLIYYKLFNYTREIKEFKSTVLSVFAG